MDIQDIQNWVVAFNQKQGWSKPGDSPFADTNFMAEEVGEVAREVRRLEIGRHGHEVHEQMNEQEKKAKLAEEMGDVLNCLATIGHRYGISLEDAFNIHRAKLEKGYGSLNE